MPLAKIYTRRDSFFFFVFRRGLSDSRNSGKNIQREEVERTQGDGEGETSKKFDLHRKVVNLGDVGRLAPL